MIEEDLAPSSDIVTCEDAALPGLRIELLTLERNIQELANAKAEYLSMIHAFNEECNRRLGELIKKLVKLREERLFMFEPKSPDSSNDDAYEKSTNVRIPDENSQRSGGKTAIIPMGKRPAFRLECGRRSGENGQYKLRV